MLKSFSLYAIGQFLTQFLSILLLPIYLKELSIEEYGIVASLMSVATFFNAIMQYGAGPSIMRFYFEYDKGSKEFNGFFTSVLLFNFCANLIFVFLIYIGYQSLFAIIIPDISIAKYIWYIVFYSFFFAFPVLNLSLFRVESKPVSFLVFSIIQFLLSFIIIFYMVAILKEGAIGKIKGEFWARLPLFIVGFYLFRKYVDFTAIKIKYIKEALKYGAPLMFQALLWWGLYKVDYFLINRVLGNEGVGLFNVGFQVSYILITLGISFSLAWTPHFFAIAKNNSTKKLYGNMIGNFLMLLTILGITALLFISDILVFLDAKAYLPINAFLPYLIFGAIFQAGYYMVQQLLFYAKKTTLIPIILGGFLVVIFGLEYLILPNYGLEGISIVKALGFVCIFVTTLLVGIRHYYFKVNLNKVYFVLLTLLLNGIIIYNFNLLEQNTLVRLGWLIVNIMSIWGFRFLSDEETNSIKKIIKKG